MIKMKLDKWYFSIQCVHVHTWCVSGIWSRHFRGSDLRQNYKYG